MSGNSAEVRKRSGNLCSQENLIVAPRQNNLPVLYSYCNSFFVSDVHGEFDQSLQFRLEKSGIFFCLESGNPGSGLDSLVHSGVGLCEKPNC